MKNKDLLTKSEAGREMLERLLLNFGRYKRYRVIQPELVRRIVFVCKGNICRSALAEQYLRQNDFPTASFGISCENGNPANETMIQLAGKNGIPLQDHKTKSARNFAFLPGDLLVAMEPRQISALKNLSISTTNVQYALLGLYASRQRASVIDPYGKEERFFDETISILVESIDSLCDSIKNP